MDSDVSGAATHLMEVFDKAEKGQNIHYAIPRTKQESSYAISADRSQSGPYSVGKAVS